MCHAVTGRHSTGVRLTFEKCRIVTGADEFDSDV